MLPNIMKAYRIKHNMFQKDLAFLVGCSKSTLSLIEAGKQSPKADIVLNILNVVVPGFGEQLLLLDLDADIIVSKYKPVVNYHTAVKSSGIDSKNKNLFMNRTNNKAKVLK